MFFSKGYLKKCKEHSKLFTTERIQLIFGNIKDIYVFQKGVLNALEAELKRETTEDIKIGNIFIANVCFNAPLPEHYLLIFTYVMACVCVCMYLHVHTYMYGLVIRDTFIQVLHCYYTISLFLRQGLACDFNFFLIV